MFKSGFQIWKLNTSESFKSIYNFLSKFDKPIRQAETITDLFSEGAQMHMFL